MKILISGDKDVLGDIFGLVFVADEISDEPSDGPLIAALTAARLEERIPTVERSPRAFPLEEGLYLACAGIERDAAARIREAPR